MTATVDSSSRTLTPVEQDDGDAPYISLVIPCYNEEESVDELVTEVIAVLDDNKLDGEVVLVDDGSSDRTWEKLSGWAEKDARLKLVRFRRSDGLRRFWQNSARPDTKRAMSGCCTDAMESGQM